MNDNKLSIEEKAKAYDEAIKVAQRFYNNSVAITKKGLEDIFPELKESEDEEIKEMLKVAVERTPWMQDKKEKCYEWLEAQGEQKPAELPKGEDYGIDGLYHAIRILEETIGSVDGYQSDDGILEHKCAISAVKQLAKQDDAWSEEDEKMLVEIVNDLQVCKSRDISRAAKDAYQKEIDWLKSLKDRVQSQPKHRWSEEDKKIIDRIESEFLALHRGDYKNIDFNNVDNLSVLNWVRKIKFLCFQSRWKPSDEQMNTLEYYMHTLVCNEHKEILFGLYSCLKKLREE